MKRAFLCIGILCALAVSNECIREYRACGHYDSECHHVLGFLVFFCGLIGIACVLELIYVARSAAQTKEK
jgi:hypothetical protein